jgi:hypothetical protein
MTFERSGRARRDAARDRPTGRRGAASAMDAVGLTCSIDLTASTDFTGSAGATGSGGQEVCCQ